jgi:U3 small nucleolar RNA-associated protein 4
MDVHRARFVPYPGSAINALAFSASNDKELGRGGVANLRLAVGRANGDIEIWNPAKGSFVQEAIFRGGKDRSVEGLAWIQEPEETDSAGKRSPGKLRLFSIGYSSTVTEWNLATGLPIRQSSGNHSEVWCLAAQPRFTIKQRPKKEDMPPKEDEWKGQHLVAGCADGTLALLSTAENDLHFQKFISRATDKKARALSLDFINRDIVVAGYADSAIRIFDTRNSTLVRAINLGAGPQGGPKSILVWGLKCLPNGDIVTGDSTGEVRFFEGKNYSQYQRIKAHDADILDIASNADGSMIFSTGMDRKTTVFTRPVLKNRRWAKAASKKCHEHDVKALQSFDGQSLSVMASGGMCPCALYLRISVADLHRTRHESCHFTVS